MAWYNASWTYRKKITVDKTKLGGADQTAFPVLVNLADLGADFFTNVESDGTDIVVTTSDGTTKCKRELSWIDTANSKGELYFKGTLSSSTNTDFYIYYGNASGAETNDTDTWDSNFVAVYHFSETSGGSGAVKDSTANANHGTDSGSPTFNQTGKYGRAIDFERDSNQYITSADQANQRITGSYSFEAWIKIESSPPAGNVPIVAKANAGGYNYFFDESNTNYLLTGHFGTGWQADTSDNVIGTGAWKHVAGVFDASADTITSYREGASDGNTGSITDDPTAASPGALYLASGSLGGYFDGLIEEIRISNTARAASWITTTYNNTNSSSTFYAVGSQESNAPAGSTKIYMTTRSKMWGA